MKSISLSQNQYTFVDNEDFDRLNQYSWYLSDKGYAVRNIRKPDGKRGLERMHRVIAKTPSKFVTDHINGNRLDNRRSNLRNCTSSQNSMNKKGDRGAKSKYKGVYWFNSPKKWGAQIFAQGKLTYIGLFSKEHQAAMAYDLWAKDLFGEYAKTNF